MEILIFLFIVLPISIILLASLFLVIVTLVAYFVVYNDKNNYEGKE